MDEVEVVKEGDRAEQLACKGLYVRSRERHEATGLEEVEDGQAEQRSNNADVSSPIEAVP